MKKLSILLIAVLMFSALAFSETYNRAVKVKGKQKTEDTVIAANSKYYALIIGNNNYKHLPKLKTARNDAVAVEKLLKNKYGFQTKLLLDATRTDIIDSISEFRKKLGEKDNLLIYYAGHGEFDRTVDKAYWIPVDARKDSDANWIIADDITSNIKRLSSKHILIVSDSCYSGTLTRASLMEMKKSGERDEYLKKMAERSSRTLMASGGNEPVADSGGGNNSVFASAFLTALMENEKGVFTAEELFHSRVKSIVAGKSEQVPEYAEIRNSGHSGGDFVFQLARSGLTESQGPTVSTEVSEETKKLQEEKEKLKKEREELEQAKAIIEEKKRLEEERQKLEKEKQQLAMKSKPQSDFTTGIDFTGKWEVYNCGAGKYVTLDIKQVDSNISGINSNGYKFSGYYDGNKLSILYSLNSLNEVLTSFNNLNIPQKAANELVGRNDTVYVFNINKTNEKVFYGQQKRLCVQWNSYGVEKVSIDEYWGNCPPPCSSTLKRIE